MPSLIQFLFHRGQLLRPTYATPFSTFRSRIMSDKSYSHPPTDSEPSMASSTTPSKSSPQEKLKELLALPESTHDPKATELDMSTGETTIKLDHLGPMVVNVDGTLSRISNWQGMSDLEKQNTLRIIGKRNQTRLEVLKEKDEQQQGS